VVLIIGQYPHSWEGRGDKRSAARGISRVWRAQSLFAMERHMDRIAQVGGLSPVEIRRRNFLKPGQTTTTEQRFAKN